MSLPNKASSQAARRATAGPTSPCHHPLLILLGKEHELVALPTGCKQGVRGPGLPAENKMMCRDLKLPDVLLSDIMPSSMITLTLGSIRISKMSLSNILVFIVLQKP